MSKKKWFEDASTKLRELLEGPELDRIDGSEYLLDYIKDCDTEEYPELDFGDDDEELERIVRGKIEEFEDWLRINAADWIYFGKGYRWQNRKTKTKAKRRVVVTEPESINEEELKVLHKTISQLKPDDIHELDLLYQKLLNGPELPKIAECAYRIAMLKSESKEYNYYDQAAAWESAGEKGLEAGRPRAHESFYKAAEIYRSKMIHDKSAQMFEKSVNEVSKVDISKPWKFDAIRNARVQYEWAGDTNSASRMYVEESNMELASAEYPKKAFLFSYKILCNYGESPFRVAAFAVVLILGCALIYTCVGIASSGPDKDIKSFFVSLYYSVVTFTTLGYGDYSPVNFYARFFSALEAVLGLLLTSLFLVTVVRKYSR